VIRPRKIFVVATFEFLSTVKRKAYLITTFGMPLFVALYGGVMALPGLFISASGAKTKTIGLIDESGLRFLTGEAAVGGAGGTPESTPSLEELARGVAVPEIPRGRVLFRPFGDERQARSALLGGELNGYFVIPGDYLKSGRVQFYKSGGSALKFDVDGGSALRSLLLERLLEGRLDEKLASRVSRPIQSTETFQVGEEGLIEPTGIAQQVARLVIPLLFTVLLFTSLMMSAGYLIQAIAVEKENRVVEVLLSSASPEEILSGKLLGLGAAGLLQIGVWYGLLIAGGLAFAGTLTALGIEVPWLTIALAFLLFVLAYLFLGSLMLGSGSLGTTMKESQQYSVVWTMLSVIPLMMLFVFLTEPNGVVPKVLTWIPFTAPLTLLLRMSLEPEGVAWWEIAGATLVMLVSTWFGIRLAARLFRVGLLLTGARLSLREIIRQARLSS